MRVYPSDFVDSAGHTWPTIGENIRHGAKHIPENGYWAYVHLTLDAATWNAEIESTNYPGSSLTANSDSGELYFTDSNASSLDIVDTEIRSVTTCTGGSFILHKQGVHQTSGILMSSFECSATTVDITLYVTFREGES